MSIMISVALLSLGRLFLPRTAVRSVAAVALLFSAYVLCAHAQDAPPAVTLEEVLSRVGETQAVQRKLEAEIRGVRDKLDAEVAKLMSWSTSEGDKRLSWRMIADKVETGFFNHDIVARVQVSGVEVRCRVAASDANKDLKDKFPPGHEFVCNGRLQEILSNTFKTVVILKDSVLSDFSSGGSIVAELRDPAAAGKTARATELSAAERSLDNSTEVLASCDWKELFFKDAAQIKQIVGGEDQAKICEVLTEVFGKRPQTKVFGTVAKASYLISMDGRTSAGEAGYQIARIIEARGITDADRARTTADLVYSIFKETNGRVTPKDLNVALRAKRGAAATFSDKEFVTLSLMINEAKKAKGE